MADLKSPESGPKLEISIKPIGSYFEIDKDGFVVNPASKEKIQEEWKPVVDEVVNKYKEIYGASLRCVYIRGSVAKGQAVSGVSDVDTLAYVDLTKEQIKTDERSESAVKEARKEIASRYNFVEGVEMHASPVADFEKDLIILNQSVCVYGEPLEIPHLKVGKDLAIHSLFTDSPESRLGKFQRKLDNSESDATVKKSCVWIMKNFLRMGFEITMERSKKYTRDLYLCYETFSEYYPEKQVDMREVLNLALNPTADKEKIKEILDGFGLWLLQEAKRFF